MTLYIIGYTIGYTILSLVFFLAFYMTANRTYQKERGETWTKDDRDLFTILGCVVGVFWPVAAPLSACAFLMFLLSRTEFIKRLEK